MLITTPDCAITHITAHATSEPAGKTQSRVETKKNLEITKWIIPCHQSTDNRKKLRVLETNEAESRKSFNYDLSELNWWRVNCITPMSDGSPLSLLWEALATWRYWSRDCWSTKWVLKLHRLRRRLLECEICNRFTPLAPDGNDSRWTFDQGKPSVA